MIGIVPPIMGGASTTKDYLVKGAASKKRKTYRTPDFITGRFDDRATTNIAILSSFHGPVRGIFPSDSSARWCPGDSAHCVRSGPSHCLLRPFLGPLGLSRNSYPTGPSPYTCPGVDTPPDTTSPMHLRGSERL